MSAASRRSRRLLAAPLAGLALAAGACGGDGGDRPTPPPAEVAVDGGRTVVEPAPGPRDAGVRIAPIAPARGDARAIILPVRDGRLAPDGATGEVAHRGGVLVSARRTEVEVVDLRLDAGAGEVTAVVAARRMPLLTLGRRAPAGGPGAEWTARLTPEAATLLNDLLGVRALSSGPPFARVRLRAPATR